jgi:twitching motility protein PilI
LSLKELIDNPFALLLEIERRAKQADSRGAAKGDTADDWIGVAFRLGSERFVTARSDVREVLPAPEQVTRIPGAKAWLRGIANVRGQLLTIVDLKAFLGAGPAHTDRKARMLLLASRDVPSAVIVDEVLGFRRFAETDFSEPVPVTEVRCDHYLVGTYRRDRDTYPVFDLGRLLGDPGFLSAGVLKADSRGAA